MRVLSRQTKFFKMIKKETITELLEVKKFKPQYLPNFSSKIFLMADKML